MPRYSAWGGLVLLMLLMMACSSHERQDWAKNKIKEIKIQPGIKPDPLPALNLITSTQVSENYAPIRSPFELKRREKKSDLNQPDMRRKKDFLEQFALENLKLVGTLEEGNKRWGLIKLPSGMIYKVTEGSYLGKNFGRVIEIKDNTMIIEERVAHDGVWQKSLVTLTVSSLNTKTSP
jgi:type IV pilus assembly protein PilP